MRRLICRAYSSVFDPRRISLVERQIVSAQDFRARGIAHDGSRVASRFEHGGQRAEGKRIQVNIRGPVEERGIGAASENFQLPRGAPAGRGPHASVRRADRQKLRLGMALQNRQQDIGEVLPLGRVVLVGAGDGQQDDGVLGDSQLLLCFTALQKLALPLPAESGASRCATARFPGGSRKACGPSPSFRRLDRRCRRRARTRDRCDSGTKAAVAVPCARMPSAAPRRMDECAAPRDRNPPPVFAGPAPGRAGRRGRGPDNELFLRMASAA